MVTCKYACLCRRAAMYFATMGEGRNDTRTKGRRMYFQPDYVEVGEANHASAIRTIVNDARSIHGRLHCTGRLCRGRPGHPAAHPAGWVGADTTLFNGGAPGTSI